MTAKNATTNERDLKETTSNLVNSAMVTFQQHPDLMVNEDMVESENVGLDLTDMINLRSLIMIHLLKIM